MTGQALCDCFAFLCFTFSYGIGFHLANSKIVLDVNFDKQMPSCICDIPIQTHTHIMSYVIFLSLSRVNLTPFWEWHLTRSSLPGLSGIHGQDQTRFGQTAPHTTCQTRKIRIVQVSDIQSYSMVHYIPFVLSK